MDVRDGLPRMSTRIHADPVDGWKDKPGNSKRIRHLRRALDEFNGRVDVVIVSGKPGESYGTAQPWLAVGARAGTHWIISDFEEETGHFEASLVLAGAQAKRPPDTEPGQ
jgi:hypothetical protein